MQIQAGKLVKLKSGGPLMTVTEIVGDQVIVRYFGWPDYTVRSASLPYNTLLIVTPQQAHLPEPQS